MNTHVVLKKAVHVCTKIQHNTPLSMKYIVQRLKEAAMIKYLAPVAVQHPGFAMLGNR